jgi:hypothetical protein
MLSNVSKFLGLTVIALQFLIGNCDAGYVFSSTVEQNGSKVNFNKTPQNPAGTGSASKIGLYSFGSDADQFKYIQAKIRVWVQLPPEAIGDKAPFIVIAKSGTLDLDLALTVGDAVRLDLRISYDMFPSSNGVVEKETEFESLTFNQSRAIAAIMAKDPDRKVEAWLASDDFKAITVPASYDTLQIVNGRPTIVTKILNSTLTLEAVPEPSTIALFLVTPWMAHTWNRRRTRPANSKPNIE